MKIFFFKNLSKPISFVILLISLVYLKSDFLNAEYLTDESQDDYTTKTEGDSSVLPTNPFEIVNMIKRYNSLNDATKPSDAIEDALKSFNSLDENN